MSDWHADPDVAETIENLIGIVADEQYEGWPDYWQAHRDTESRLRALLDEWAAYCKSRVGEETR